MLSKGSAYIVVSVCDQLLTKCLKMQVKVVSLRKKQVRSEHIIKQRATYHMLMLFLEMSIHTHTLFSQI